eukprot:scaffold1319_cov126-Cylindrotheca_fusiformis.AAC.53
MPTKILVVGATGATGKHVVKMMLDKGNSVVAIVRSKDTLLRNLKDANYGDSLQIHEAAILDLSHEELSSLTKDCDFVVSCLGHNLTFKGMFVKDRRLVATAVKRLSKAMPASCKLILMGSDGVAHAGDPKRKSAERFVLFLLRYLIPPHADNMEAAAYLRATNEFDWAVVRPTNLVNEDDATGKYTVTEHAETPLFGDQTVSRNNVAHFMVELMTDETKYGQYKHKMPVLVGSKN